MITRRFATLWIDTPCPCPCPCPCISRALSPHHQFGWHQNKPRLTEVLMMVEKVATKTRWPWGDYPEDAAGNIPSIHRRQSGAANPINPVNPSIRQSERCQSSPSISPISSIPSTKQFVVWSTWQLWSIRRQLTTEGEVQCLRFVTFDGPPKAAEKFDVFLLDTLVNPSILNPV